MTQADLAKPTLSQLAWKDLEYGMFIHLEHAEESRPDEPVPTAAAFNPEKLDTDQWMEAAKAFGAKLAVLTRTG
jgi:alpha-L-fucosidase